MVMHPLRKRDKPIRVRHEALYFWSLGGIGIHTGSRNQSSGKYGFESHRDYTCLIRIVADCAGFVNRKRKFTLVRIQHQAHV